MDGRFYFHPAKIIILTLGYKGVFGCVIAFSTPQTYQIHPNLSAANGPVLTPIPRNSSATFFFCCRMEGVVSALRLGAELPKARHLCLGNLHVADKDKHAGGQSFHVRRPKPSTV
jgi:hypothetical protein